MTREPLFNAAILVAIVSTGITMLVAFGLPVTPDQTKAILGFVTVVAPLVVAWLTRNKVTPLSDPRNRAGERLVISNAEEVH